jgi:hypothetical protein
MKTDPSRDREERLVAHSLTLVVRNVLLAWEERWLI